MPLLLPNLRSVTKRWSTIQDALVKNAVRGLEEWAEMLTQRLASLEAATGGGALSDGDYGDITVSGAGTVMALDAGVVGTTELADEAVTLAKMADMATDSFIGRDTAGTGVPEVLSGATATTLLSSYAGAAKGLVPVGAGSTTKFLREDGSWATPAGGSGGGLFSANLSAKPTQSSTGFSNWMNQPASATVNDDASGITVYCPNQASSDVVALLYKTVPSTPYTIKALVTATADPTSNTGVVLGWADGSGSGAKRIVTIIKPCIAVADALMVGTYTGSNPGTFNGYLANWTTYFYGPILWLKMVDDGTNAIFSISHTGDDNAWIQIRSIIKTGSHLGTSGFTHLVFGSQGYNGDCRAQLLSWSVS